METTVQVGTILIENRPLIMRTLNLESEPYSGPWSVEPDFRKRAKAGLQLPRSHENRGEPLSGPALHNGLCTFAAYSARLPAGVN